jgi:hypothetical protein
MNSSSFVGPPCVAIALGPPTLDVGGGGTLAQVYLEVESSRLAKIEEAALVAFVYRVIPTGTISALAVMMIPDDKRVSKFGGDLVGGLARQVIGSVWAIPLVRTFVVLVGFLTLREVVNTAITGHYGVLSRVAGDGVMPARKTYHTLSRYSVSNSRPSPSGTTCSSPRGVRFQPGLEIHGPRPPDDAAALPQTPRGEFAEAHNIGGDGCEVPACPVLTPARLGRHELHGR